MASKPAYIFRLLCLRFFFKISKVRVKTTLLFMSSSSSKFDSHVFHF